MLFFILFLLIFCVYLYNLFSFNFHFFRLITFYKHFMLSSSSYSKRYDYNNLQTTSYRSEFKPNPLFNTLFSFPTYLFSLTDFFLYCHCIDAFINWYRVCLSLFDLQSWPTGPDVFPSTWIRLGVSLLRILWLRSTLLGSP